MVLINLSSCSLFYTTQDTPRRVDAIPLFGVKIDKSSTHGAFCVMEPDNINLAGQKYGRWTIVELLGKNEKNELLIKCICDCGNERTLKLINIKYGSSKSCGCLSKEVHSKHGLKKHPLFMVWCSMRQRCSYEKYPGFHRYGVRGIRVCEEWNNDFKTFHDWAIANGWEVGLSIDRIDNDGNYEPSNCRWATMLTQARNTSKNVMVEHEGEIKCLSEWAKVLNINLCRIARGIKRGHTLAEIIAKPRYKQFKKTA